MKNRNEIVLKLPKAVLLEQAAEEAAELAQACLKLARIYRGENPTPVTEEKAIANFKEEAADVYLCLSALDEVGYDVSFDTLYNRMSAKLDRWVQRLEDAANEN